ncbi:MAG: DNA polymerase IV [Actinomycetes bacterium]
MFVSHRAILHLDMDAFFASVEQARRPALRGLPVIVGGERGGRGVVSACSYEARAFGVHSAMPIFQAERLCPRGVFLPVDMKAYMAVHRDLVELLGRYTDLVEVASIDEAYLDVTGSRRLFGPPRAIALRVQQQVYDAHGVTCSIGIGPTKPLAKLAAGLNKPAGIGELTDADVHGRLRGLPVGAVCGIGPVTQERLAALGLTTVGMLQDVPFPLLAAAFGRGAHGLRQLALGRGFSPVSSARPLPRSVGREVTFADDTNDLELLRATLLALTDNAVAELRRQGLAARTVALKVRFSTFHTVGRRRTLARSVSATRPLYETAVALLDELGIGARWVRLVGVSVSGFTHNAFQLTLDEGWREVALGEAVDRVREKYGFKALKLAGGAAAERHLERPSPGLAFTPSAAGPPEGSRGA